MKLSRLFVGGVIVFGLVGCSATKNMPLIFGQTHTVGITIGASAVDQGAEFVLGYKDRDVAVIPVTVEQASGDSTLVKATVNGSQDAMSVIGQFEVDSSSEGATRSVGLGKFFATGIAAQQLATGFKKKLAGEVETVESTQQTE